MKTTTFFLSLTMLLWGSLTFGQWTQLNNDINGSTADDRLGSAVTLSANGNRIATGAPLYNNGAAADAGQVRLYEQQGAIWTVIAQYAGAAAGDGLGTSVSLSADGNRLAVGVPLNDAAGNNAGQVYLYHYTAGSWSLITTLNGELANDQFGSSVSLSADGMRLAVGAPFNDAGTGNAADNRGRVRLYQYNGASWVAFPNALANSINGLAAGDQSGRTVSLSTDGSRVAIGAPLGDGGFADSGYTRIFQYNSGTSTWEQLGSALNGEAAGDQSGAAVSLSADGNRVAIGAPLNDADSGIATDNPGHVRVYQYSAGAWTQVGTDLNGYALGDQFGKAVSLNTDGSRLAIGAPFANGSAGQTQVYQLHGSSWLPLGVAFNGEAGGDEAGSSVSLSAEGSRVAIGAPLNDGGGLSAGQVRLYEYAIPDTSLGEGAGTDASGQANMFLGYYSGHNTTTGSDNTFVGAESGYSNTTGSGNVFLGYRSGYNETTGNDHLFIDNSATDNPLIWGDFAADALRVNGSLAFTNALMPNNTAGLAGQVLTSAGAGATPTWANPLNTLLTGLVGGQTIKGGTAASENLTLTSTHHATKGKILFGTSAYDELNNRLGIGTATPVGKLHVNGSAYIGNENGTALYRVSIGGSGGSYGSVGYGYKYSVNNSEYKYAVSDYASQIEFASGGFNFKTAPIGVPDGVVNFTNALRIQQNGNVGIGTTSPDRNLTIYDGDGSSYLNLKDGTREILVGADSGGGVISTMTNHDLQLRAGGNNTKMIIKTDGNVGIGTASPNAGLHINKAGTWGSLVIQNQYAGNVTHFDYPDGKNYIRGTTIIADVGGNVGIGTASPQDKLHVYGRLNSTINSNEGGSISLVNPLKIGAVLANTWTIYNMTGPYGNSLQFWGYNNTGAVLGSKFTIADNGNVGIGVGIAAPGYMLHVNGSAGKPGGGDWTNSSDRRLKQDITPFTDGLEKVKQINPVWYRYNGLAGLPTEERYVGIIAQEMQEVAPYTIGTFTYTDKEGNTTDYLDYDGSAVKYMLVNAIKEQQQQLDEQKRQNETLREELETLKSAVYGTSVKTPNISSKNFVESESQSLPDGFALYQNVPNPFDKSTVIVAQLPESVQQAKIVVYNLQGLELASYPLGERGKVSVEISGGRFPAGMYLYALLADGQVIDTKKMILTD